MATGAIILVAVIALGFTLFNPTKAQAQAAAAATPGATTMVVTIAPGGTADIGIITINDPIGRKATVVSYLGEYTNNAAYTAPGSTIALSSPASFSY